MEIDLDVPMSGFSSLESGLRRPSEDINQPVNGLVLSSTEAAYRNGDVPAVPGLASPSFRDGLVTQQPGTLANLKNRENSEPNQDAGVQLKSASFAESGSSLGDEITVGDIAWSMPIVQPKLLATGLCYDVRMRYHCELEAAKPRLDFHPEDPRRIYHIYRELCQAGLYKDPQFDVPIVEKPLERIRARNATASEICLVHHANHYHFMESTAATPDEDLVHLERQYDSIYFNRLTFSSALLSAGGAIETCKAVISGRVKNAIAVIRPPGHHAECNRPMGFCLFDNVSIAARVCQADFPEVCRKVLVLDWDVHHGNGIQQDFYNDPNVLYISIHVHEDGTFYPPGPFGDHMHCGAGAGLGRNINIPWPTKGMGDADYLYAFQQVVMPVAYDFNPDLVIIAAGFDAAVGDQLGGCFVTPTCYAHMTHMLSPLADGKLVVCLEGGYNLASISKSALAVTRTLLSEPPDRIMETKPTKAGAATVDMVRIYQSRFWPCLRSVSKSNTKDALRAYQKQQLCDEYDMIELSVFRDRLSKSFKHQVLATINYADAGPLLIIFHDPYHHQTGPEAARLADAEVYDTLNWYRDWAIKEGFAIIDVNFPNHIADSDDADELDYDKELEIAKHLAERAELAIYLWENYIE
ncbi:MAG: hypothetical protein LQ344_001231 [Seirophora lacunosa]|nr:MAG: hypothetical protein LQ344_001231 [Seirophora lacunosa]